MTENLASKRCVPCEKGCKALRHEQIKELIRGLADWKAASTPEGTMALQKRFTFQHFRAAMDFLRKVETVSESEGHHPDFCVHYNKVDFTLWTHAANGLHENDFILAAKIDEIWKSR